MTTPKIVAAIFASPDAYLTRIHDAKVARRIALETSGFVFHGPTAGEYWVAPKGVCCRALRAAGLECIF